MDDDDDENTNDNMIDSDGEEEDGVRFRRAEISLDQAKRIAISSAWRMRA